MKVNPSLRKVKSFSTEADWAGTRILCAVQHEGVVLASWASLAHETAGAGGWPAQAPGKAKVIYIILHSESA